MERGESRRKWASEGHIEQAAQTFREIKAIIDEVAKKYTFDDVTRKIARISASAFWSYIKKSSPQYGRVTVYTCMNLAQYSGVPYEAFCGREPFTENYKEKFRNVLIKDFSPKIEEKEKNSLSDIFLNNKMASKKSELNIKELLDYFADILAAKINEKIQYDKNLTDLLIDIKDNLRNLSEK
jgi:nitrate reductase alpha subunit